jgi:hypothetical protein
MTFDQIAAQLGAKDVEWAIDRLQRYAPLIGLHGKAYDDSFDRIAFESALYLESWLAIEIEAYKKIGDDPPDCVEDASSKLHELLPLIASYIRQPGKRGGPTPDNRRHVCAWICASIWRDFHPTAGSNSDTLLAACEAYWQACGQPSTAADLSGHLRNWKWFLPTSNSPKKSEVR